MRKRFNLDLTSTWPLAVTLAAALISVAGINFLWWRLARQANQQAGLVNHTHQVIAALEETLARADDMVIGQRGYALTREQDFLKPYFTATNRMPALILSLRTLLHDNSKQIETLDRLEISITDYEKINQEHLAGLTKSNPLSPDLEFRRKIRDTMDVIRVTIGHMRDTENELLDQRQKSSERAGRIVTRVNVIACLVSMALIVAVFVALRREIVRRRVSELELHQSHEELEHRVQQRTLSLVQSENERKRLEQEILETSDTEMRRIGHDLHDGVGQQLTALSLFTSGLQKEVEAQAPQLAEPCKKISLELREAIRQVRVLSHGLSPVSLEDNGLVEALRKLADDMRSADMNCEFTDSSEIRVGDAHIAAQFYRIGQEAVTNAARHSGARRIHISFKATTALAELEVRDDGRGFSLPGRNGKAGLGLHAMKYRADVIGAALNIDSAPGQGTRITCSIQKQT
ncbi:MAG TPA: CHASE3 domain-containing protein [Verrucomicrobiae bacterium]|nr:CHASE3 domain-containing protein [Verrucomicrobiae bacterium]